MCSAQTQSTASSQTGELCQGCVLPLECHLSAQTLGGKPSSPRSSTGAARIVRAPVISVSRRGSATVRASCNRESSVRCGKVYRAAVANDANDATSRRPLTSELRGRRDAGKVADSHTVQEDVNRVTRRIKRRHSIVSSASSEERHSSEQRSSDVSMTLESFVNRKVSMN